MFESYLTVFFAYAHINDVTQVLKIIVFGRIGNLTCKVTK